MNYMAEDRTLRRLLLAWGPVLVFMALIFVASAQPKHAPPPGTDGFYFSGSMPVFEGGWETIIKKSAHVAAYSGLTLLIIRGLRHSGSSPREAALLGVILAASFAISDEMHQTAVAGRNGTVLDIGLDYVGAVLASWTQVVQDRK